MLIPLLLLLCGFLVSAFGTLIGFGGGVFMIPILVIFFKIKIQLAVGMVAISLFPSALISTIFNFRQGLIDFKTALIFEIPTVIGAIIGAYLADVLSVQTLEIIFSTFLIYIALKMLIVRGETVPGKGTFISRLNQWGPRVESEKLGHSYTIGIGAITVLGSTAGILAGIFGMGGGFMKTPIMVRVFKMPPKVAVGTALAMIVVTSLASSISHYSLGHIQWNLALPLLTGFMAGAVTGNYFKKYMTDLHTDKLISFGLLLAGVSILHHCLS